PCCGIRRHASLKLVLPLKAVWVQVPLRVPAKLLIFKWLRPNPTPSHSQPRERLSLPQVKRIILVGLTFTFFLLQTVKNDEPHRQPIDPPGRRAQNQTHGFRMADPVDNRAYSLREGLFPTGHCVRTIPARRSFREW